ncbi:MAG: hypothetical protein ABIK83_14200 [Candidatus Zixiibacteriota bacterium]
MISRISEGGGRVGYEVEPNTVLSVPGNGKAEVVRNTVNITCENPVMIDRFLESALDKIVGPKDLLHTNITARVLYVVEVGFVEGNLFYARLGMVQNVSDALSDLEKMLENEQENIRASREARNKLSEKIRSWRKSEDPSCPVVWNIGLTDMSFHARKATFARAKGNAKFHLLEIPSREYRACNEGANVLKEQGSTRGFALDVLRIQ